MDYLNSPGHAKLKEQSIKIAGDLGIIIVNASWSQDTITKDHILTVSAATGITKILFNGKEIQSYDQGVGVESMDKKVKKALENIVDD